MDMLTPQQIEDLVQRITVALETRVVHMVDQPMQIDVQMAIAAHQVLMNRAMVVSFLGQRVGLTDIAAVMFCLGKIAEREGWSLEYLPEEQNDGQ